MQRSSKHGLSLRARIAAAWRDLPAMRRTRPILIASICAGVLGYTLARALDLNVLLSYVITVLAVFLVATLVLARR